MPSEKIKIKSIAVVTDLYWNKLVEVDRANDREQLKHAALAFACQLGFGQIGFAIRRKLPADIDESYRYFHNIQGVYGHQRYEVVYRQEPQSDPVLDHLRKGLPAAAFSCRDGLTLAQSGNSARYRGILRSARDHGISAGIGMPISGSELRWGVMVLTTDKTDRVLDVQSGLPHLCLLAHHVYCRIAELDNAKQPTVLLTGREAEVLKWSALGKSSWEMSLILCISEATVNYHINSCTRKLGVIGRRAACARALALNLISV